MAPNQPAAVERLLLAVREVQAHHELIPLRSSGDASLYASSPQALVVGVSGGKDSICLLHLLRTLASDWHLDLHIAHCNHRLRESASRDSQFVEQLAADWALSFHVVNLDPAILAQSPDGLEAAARRARYDFLADTAHAVTPPGQEAIVAVAHQRDDQVETILMNLIRGSGVHGLGGMNYVSHRRLGTQWHSVRIIRPLLDVPGTWILEYLVAVKQPWYEDETNQDQSRLRNRVRYQLVPLLRDMNPRLDAAITRTADILRAETERLDAEDQCNFQDVVSSTSRSVAAWEVTPSSKGAGLPDSKNPLRLVFDASALRALSPAAQRGIMRLALAKLRLDRRHIGVAEIDNLLQQFNQELPAGGPYSLAEEFCWSVAAKTTCYPPRISIHHRTVLPFAPEHPYLVEGTYLVECFAINKLADNKNAHQETTIRFAPSERPSIHLPIHSRGAVETPTGWTLAWGQLDVAELPYGWRQPHAWRVFLDAAQISRPHLTVPRPGLRFAAFGLRGKHKQLGDYFTDKKVPTSLRARWPIIYDADSGEILWVCGYEIAYHARIVDDTKQVFSFEWSSTARDSHSPT